MILAWAIATTFLAVATARRNIVLHRANKALDEMLTASEAARLRIEKEHFNYRAQAARRRGQDLPTISGSGVTHLRLLPGDPDSKYLLDGGA